MTEPVADPEASAEETRDRINVGVSTVVGTLSLSVGTTMPPLGPKKGALPGSNMGPVSA